MNYHIQNLLILPLVLNVQKTHLVEEVEFPISTNSSKNFKRFHPMTDFIYDQADFDIRDYMESNWESLIETSEEDWQSCGIIENLDSETIKMLNEF